jgi:hypothetical protein
MATVDLDNLLKESRPNLKESSRKTYINNLNKLGKEVGIKKINNLKFLQNGGNIFRALQQKKKATQKTYLASIVVFLKAIEAKKNLIDFYTEKMNTLSEEYNEKITKQEKSENQEANWVELPVLIKEIERQGREITRMRLWTKKKLTPGEFDQIQRYVAGALYVISDENPPMRSDYADMKVISNEDYDKLSKEALKENYLVNESARNKFFHLANYKTSGDYGVKNIKVGKKLNNILNKWLKINDSGYLLINNRKKPMSPNGLTKYMNKVFSETGRKIGISLIRHIFLSHHFPAQNAEKQEVADKMMHSVSMATNYSKK